MKKTLDPIIFRNLSKPRYYLKGTTIASEGDRCQSVGFLVKGDLVLVHYSFEGDEKVLGKLTTGDFFGDFLIHSEEAFFPGHLICESNSQIIYFNHQELDYLLETNTVFRQYYLKNLCDKALLLNQHNKILTQTSLKEKILLYLEQSLSKGVKKIPISSQEKLAAYLNVKRPSLSRVLSQLKNEQLIDYDRHHIWLHPVCEISEHIRTNINKNIPSK